MISDWVRRVGAEADGRVVTSALSRLECRVKPLRLHDADLLSAYDGFLNGGEIEILPITDALMDRAARIRAEQQHKTPDAIHLASAVECGADVNLTGDQRFARFQQIRVELVKS